MLAREGAISWTETQDQARAVLVQRWKADGEAPGLLASPSTAMGAGGQVVTGRQALC